MKRAIVPILLARGCALAQSPAFEVASVKLVPPSRGMGGFHGCRRMDPTRYVCTGATVALLASQAYSLKPYQIGDVWGDKDQYDVEARVPADASAPDLRLMLQNLLAERFKLQFHYRKKEMPVYELAVAKSGLKLEAAPQAPTTPGPPGSPVKDADGFVMAPPRPGEMRIGRLNGLQRVVGNATGLGGLMSDLNDLLQVPVIDSTGLTGKYNYRLTFTMEGLPGAPRVDQPDPGPTVFAALEKQAGLTLEKTNREIDVFVIDRVDKSAAVN